MTNLAATNACIAPKLAGTCRQRERPRLPRDGIGRLYARHKLDYK